MVVTADCPDVAVESSPAQWRRAHFRRTQALARVLVALLLVWTGMNTCQTPPSGPGVSWDDWVHWAAVTLGLRPTPSPAPVFSPTVTMGSVAY